jgi:hypothetical protein
VRAKSEKARLHPETIARENARHLS